MKADWLLFALAVAEIVATQQECEIESSGSQKCARKEHQCTLYMAESTIPGAGLGLFTGVDRKANETIWRGDVVFPLIDVDYHMQSLGSEVLETFIVNPVVDHVWFGPEMGMQNVATLAYDPDHSTVLA